MLHLLACVAIFLQLRLAAPCLDKPPGGGYTCAQQKSWGKCDVKANPWMIGYWLGHMKRLHTLAQHICNTCFVFYLEPTH